MIMARRAASFVEALVIIVGVCLALIMLLPALLIALPIRYARQRRRTARIKAKVKHILQDAHGQEGPTRVREYRIVSERRRRT